MTGIDCAGLWIVVMNALDIRRWDTTKYSRRPNHKEFRDAMLDAGFTPIGKLEHGVVCRVEEKNWAVHTVIYELDENDVEWIIHAWAPAKKVVRERLTRDRKLRIREIMRFPQ